MTNRLTRKDQVIDRTSDNIQKLFSKMSDKKTMEKFTYSDKTEIIGDLKPGDQLIGSANEEIKDSIVVNVKNWSASTTVAYL